MKHLCPTEQEWRSRILWWLVLGTGVLVLVFSMIEAFSFSFSKIAVLAVAIFVSTLVSQYEARIPETKITVAPKNILAFWGIIWLGIPGGLLLGATASIASHAKFRGNKRAWFTAVSTDIVSIFISAVVFHTSLDYFKILRPASVPDGLLIPNEVIFASLLMALTHFAVSSALVSLLFRFESRRLIKQKSRELFLLPAAAHGASLVATILLFLTFNHFGVEFGLVIVPIAVFGNFAHKIHLRSLEQKTKQITEASRMHLATVEALATAIDARDQVGVGHVRRTQIYAVGIGNILGLSENEIDALRTAALLHDIGKLAIPDHILNKPGKLTPAEMDKIRIHSSVGASILEKVGFPYPVVPTVKYHHECWDGSGYPERLMGNKIPLTARILTVADAYDSLRGARPYRPAISRKDARNFVDSGAGTQFDPKIVSIFLSNLNVFEDQIAAEGLGYELDIDNLSEPEVHLDGKANPNYVEQIKRANREVFTLYSLARDFSSSLTLEETLSLFTRKVAEFVPFDTCIVYLLDETREFATAVHVDGRNGEALKGNRVTVGEGATGFVLKKCESVENIDPSLDFAFSDHEFSRDYLVMASLPLIADEKLIGAVSLYSSHLPNYQDEHLRLLETVSLIAGDAIYSSLQHAEAETRALTDPMTLLPNARSLRIQFDKELARASRSGTSFQLLVLDLDGFKAVNDTFGHKTGDRMLKSIGDVIKGQLRDYDFLARYGGDEFVAVIPDTENADVLELCKRIETAVNEFILPVSDDTFARVGISVGSASFPNHGETFDQILNTADKAMYLTKAFNNQRKNRIVSVIQTPSRSSSFESKGNATDRNAAATYAESEIAELDFGDEPIVELDETQILSSSAVH